MLAIKITHTPLTTSPRHRPSPLQAEQTGGQLIAAPRLVVARVNYVGIWRLSKQNQSANLSYLRHFMWFIGSWTGAYPLPHLEHHSASPPPSLTWRHIGRYKRQDIHFILTIAALYRWRRRGRLGQDLVHLIGCSAGDGSSHCQQQQQTIENPNRNQIVGFVAFANHRETLRV